ncbi:protein FAM222A isoform X3 [Camelus dromedarius]|uniref:protein FAM222A isoform X3 n=1 Tax=Camelus dromedarius TaxID=9838 RepID=UPI0031196D43
MKKQAQKDGAACSSSHSRVLVVAVPCPAPGLSPPSSLLTCPHPGPPSRSPGQPALTSLAALAAGQGAEAAGSRIAFPVSRQGDYKYQQTLRPKSGPLRPEPARCMPGVAVHPRPTPPRPSLGEEVGEPPCQPLNFAAKSARGGPRPRPPQDAAPRHPGNRLSAAADRTRSQGAGGGRDAASAAGASACQSGQSGAAGRTAGLAAPRRGCAWHSGEAKSRARRLRGAARGTRARGEARRRRAPGGVRLRPWEPPCAGRGHGRVRARRAPPLVPLESSRARCTVLRFVPISTLRHLDRLFLGAEAPRAAPEPAPPAAAAAAAAALRLPLPPHPGLGAGGGGAGAVSPPLFATCGGRCMPGEERGRCRCVHPRRDEPPHPLANQGAASHWQAVEREEATKTSCSWGRREGPRPPCSRRRRRGRPGERRLAEPQP